MPEDPEPAGNLSRRAVIASAAIVPVAAIRAAAQTPVPSALTGDEMKILDAFVDRLIPSDETGPGAREAGASTYINRVLAGFNASEKAGFTQGLASTDTFARKTHGSAFADLAAEKRDEVLTAIDEGKADGFPNSRAFFARVRRLTLEGMFSDPYYGGNKGFAGWDLIGYPGPRLAVSPDEQKMKIQIKPMRTSVWGNTNGH